jgi:KaiC/GvpD/RAD55 family RecA-like ATPase
MSALPIRFLDVAGMAAKAPPPVAWLASLLLPRGALTALYAPGGDGKSLFSMALAAAIANGEALAGIECEQGTTSYLDAENGEREIHRRIHTLGLPASGVRVADAGGLDLRGHMSAVKAIISEARPDLLVLDSLRSLTPGMDENDTAQTARVLDPLRRLAYESDAAILLIHHANKAGRDFRGASSIRDSVDVLWHLGRQENDPDARRRFLTCRKMRVAAEPELRWLRLEVDRGHVLIDQAEAPDDQPAGAAQPVRARLSDAILASMGHEPLRLAQIAERVGRGPKDGSVRNALGALVEAVLLVREGHTYVKVQTAQAGGLHPCTTPAETVQSAIPYRDAAPLHLQIDTLDGDAEVVRLREKFGEEVG